MFSDFSTKGSQASLAEFASSFVFYNCDSGKLGNSPNVLLVRICSNPEESNLLASGS